MPRMRKPRDLLPKGPIIIIGAGRSGSTLLQAMLDAHPDIRMLGEFEYATFDLWRAFWLREAPAQELARRAAAKAEAHAPKKASGKGRSSVMSAIQKEEFSRRAEIVRSALDQLYGLRESGETYWGFKEIWVGTDPWHNWEPFDTLYPDALYLHLLRHPLEYARSNAAWNRKPLYLDRLRSLLEDWVAYVRFNRRRAASGRYFEIRYEQLIANPDGALSALFERLGLAIDPACLAALETPWKASFQRPGWPQGTRATLGEVSGLAEIMQGLGYNEPAFDDPPEIDPNAVAPPRPTEGRMNSWRLEPPYLNSNGHGWGFSLSMHQQLHSLRGVCDTSAYPDRSPLRLLEDGKPLGPPHSLHQRIREEGQGRYSHWAENVLFFSTSDNSDPNENGREYMIEWQADDN